ncbi:MAG: hypothetical protein U0531_16185 [Dehalococcoidia bacterium]
MHVILDGDEAWSLMTLMVSQMVDKAGLSADGKAKLRKWRTDRASGTTAMNELTMDMNEALGNTLEDKTTRLVRQRGRYISSKEVG